VRRYEDFHFIETGNPVWNYSRFEGDDIRNFQNGTNYRCYELFGAHPMEVLGQKGFYFSVWAPNATYISVFGGFNDWNKSSHPLFVRLDQSGIWEGFIPGIQPGTSYKFHIHGYGGVKLDKGDPYAQFWELRPHTSSVTYQSSYHWKDHAWMRHRKHHNSMDAPWSVYEVHLASWMRPDPSNEEVYHGYEFFSDRLVHYVQEMGFTHVELMPIMEHPFDGSWGYQGTGYFAPTSRFGTPDQFRALVDAFHRAGIGVILDWVPSHFPYDAHGLFMFDGTHTYEYADMRKGYHPDWNSYIFNYKRGEVKSFLISSARYWMDQFHADGLRVDAVSSMLKLNYSRNEGQWEPNEFGGDGNLEAIAFIKDLNHVLYRDFPDTQTIAEEATDWPDVSRPTYDGGLGFGMKWMMGWMHDTLKYFKQDAVYRKYQQDQFSFSMMYYYNENFMLPLSHDEVVHGKSPMLYKMPGDEWQKFANLRLLYSYMFMHPGGKLLFMGNEFATTTEWNYKSELPWNLLQFHYHEGMKECVKDLCHLLKAQPALHENQFNQYGFEWIDLQHREESVICFMRKGKKEKDQLLIVMNMTPVVRYDWAIEVSGKKKWKEIFNSDAQHYGGTGDVMNGEIKVVNSNAINTMTKISMNIPPLALVVLR
jgi:1,4-alpha-glucan branching enzyme